MNEKFPTSQLQIVNLLENKYEIDPSYVSRMYLHLFIEENKALYILKEIRMFEESSNSLKEAKLKITDFFALLTIQLLFNNI